MKSKIHRISCLVCLYSCLSVFLLQANPSVSFESAKRALQNLEIEKARELMTELALLGTNDTSTDGELLATLARLDWHVYRDYEQAGEHLNQLRALPSHVSVAHRMLSKIEQERDNYALALYHARESVQTAVGTAAYLESFTTYAALIYEQQRTNVLQSKAVVKGPLYRVQNTLGQLLAHYPDQIGLSRLQLGISLLLGDGSQALKAFNSYYGFVDESDVWPTMQNSISLLQSNLAFLGKEHITFETFKAIVAGLGEGRFFEYAYIMVLLSPPEFQEQLLSDELVSSYVNYAQYLDFLRKETDALYRYTAQNINVSIDLWKQKTEHEQRVLQKEKELLASLGVCFDTWPSSRFNEYFNREMYHRFGSVGFVGSTNSCRQYSRVLGHIVREESITINQYGYITDLLYQELDHINTVGFPGWLFDILDVGGWSVDSTIIGIRQAYAEKPMQAFLLVVDLEHRDMVQAYAQGMMHADDFETICKGISLQLTLQFVDQLYEMYAQQGYTGADLYRKFARTFLDYVQTSAIYAHEGRHSIDQLFFPQAFPKWPSERKELYAKYSELAFASDVRIPLASMLQDLSNSDHGRANRKIIEMLQQCITNPDEDVHQIKAILSCPPQQIIACIMQADPLFHSAVLQEEQQPQGIVDACL